MWNPRHLGLKSTTPVSITIIKIMVLREHFTLLMLHFMLYDAFVDLIFFRMTRFKKEGPVSLCHLLKS
jgi:hypothetical protein